MIFVPAFDFYVTIDSDSVLKESYSRQVPSPWLWNLREPSFEALLGTSRNVFTVTGADDLISFAIAPDLTAYRRCDAHGPDDSVMPQSLPTEPTEGVLFVLGGFLAIITSAVFLTSCQNESTHYL